MKSMEMTYFKTILDVSQLQTFYKVINKSFISVCYKQKTIEWE
jgi:hypothetical protein